MEINPQGKARIRCMVFRGMFSDEAVVTVRSVGGNERDFFVESSSVEKQNDNHGVLSVKTFFKDGVRWAVLPTVYSDVIPIDEAQLIA